MADGNGIGHVGAVLPAAFGGGMAQGGSGRLFVGGFAGSANVGGCVEHDPFLCGSRGGDDGFGRAVCGGGTANGVVARADVFAVYGVARVHRVWRIAALSAVDGFAVAADGDLRAVGVSVLAAWDGLPKDYAAAARTMGANGFQTACYVTAPLLKPALRRGLTLASATCIGEFAATLFLSRPEWQTLTTLIYDYLGRAGADNYGRAMVLTAVLTALALAAFLLVDEAEGQKAV